MTDNLMELLATALALIILSMVVAGAMMADRTQRQLAEKSYDKLVAVEADIKTRKYEAYARGSEITGARLRELLMEYTNGDLAIRVDGTTIGTFWLNHSVTGDFTTTPINKVYTPVPDIGDAITNITDVTTRSKINPTSRFLTYGLLDSTGHLVGLWFKEG